MMTADQIVQNSGVGAYASSLATQPGALESFFIFLSNWQVTAAAALFTSSVLLAMMYIFSVLFRNDGLRNFVKLELSELFITAVLIIMLVTGVAAVSGLEYGNFVPENMLPEGVSAYSNIYNVTETYFNQVGDDMGKWLELNYILAVYTDSMASVTPYARPLGIGLVASPLAGLASPFKQLIYNMTVALAVAFIVNYAQLYVYLFTLAGALHYYLPIGIFLRAFTPTRKIGGALIGLAVSFLFIFPVLYSLDYMMFYSKEGGPMITFRSFLTEQMSGSSGMFGSGGKMDTFYKTNYSEGFIDLITESIAGIGKMFTSVIGGFFTLLMVFPISVIGRAFAIGFILPAFNTLILIQATRFISKAIGEEVDISSLTRLI